MLPFHFNLKICLTLGWEPGKKKSDFYLANAFLTAFRLIKFIVMAELHSITNNWYHSVCIAMVSLEDANIVCKISHYNLNSIINLSNLN